MLSPEQLNAIHHQLNNIPSSYTNKRKNELRRELNKVLREHKYASTYLPYEPTEYEIIFINRLTSINTLITLDTKINETKIFTLDTESVAIKFQSNVPSLIQLQLCSEPNSIVIIVEVHHLPKQNKKEFQLIKNLFNSLFIKQNTIFIWGEIEELKKFIQFGLFNLQQIYSSTNRNIQKEFKLYWEKNYPHHEDPNEECQCKHCFSINHDNLLALQDAVAFELRQWLDKRLTIQSFNIGLDPKLKRLNPSELQYRKSLCTYAANDCDSIYRIIIHSNIINEQYSETPPTNKFINRITDQDDEEVVFNVKGQLMIVNELSSNINSTKPIPIIRAEPPELELISSDEESMDFVRKQKYSKFKLPTLDNELEFISSDDDHPTEQQLSNQILSRKKQLTPSIDTLEINNQLVLTQDVIMTHTQERSRPLVNNEQRYPSDRESSLTNGNRPDNNTKLSAEERKRIHNRACTIKQRKRYYQCEIIRRNVDRRFTPKKVKTILREHNISFSAVNDNSKTSTSKKISLYIGIKEKDKIDEYEQIIQNLFTTAHYHSWHRNRRQSNHRTSSNRRQTNYQTPSNHRQTSSNNRRQ